MVSIERAYTYLERHSEPLYASYFSCRFLGGDCASFLNLLASCQNPDGGFGHGLEPDFCLPASSPIAVTKAFQMIESLSLKPQEMTAGAVAYLEDCFLADRPGWKTVGKEVNDHPHAPWWEYREDFDGTVIDRSWGNPTAEILGYLHANKQFVHRLDVDALTVHAVDRLAASPDMASEHEAFCFISLYDHVDEEQRKRMRPVLLDIIRRQVNFDPLTWGDYVPRPLDFISSPDHDLFSAVEEGAQAHLDYIVRTADEHGLWEPNWSWGQYEKQWMQAKENWKALLAVKFYTILEHFEYMGGDRDEHR